VCTISQVSNVLFFYQTLWLWMPWYIQSVEGLIVSNILLSELGKSVRWRVFGSATSIEIGWAVSSYGTESSGSTAVEVML